MVLGKIRRIDASAEAFFQDDPRVKKLVDLFSHGFGENSIRIFVHTQRAVLEG